MKPDSHATAHRQIELLQDGLLSLEEQQSLARHLAGCAECRAYADNLAALETSLRASLQKRWPLKPKAGAELEALLGEIKFSSRREPMQTNQPRPFPILAWIGLVALIVLIVSFSIRTLLPAPAASPQSSAAPATMNAPVVPATSAPATDEPAPSDLPDSSATPAPPVSATTGLFPQVQFNFTEPLPPAPEQLGVYRLVLGEPVSPETALAQADAFGLNGRVFDQPSEGMGSSLYAVSDGYSLARFLNFPTQFLYWPGTVGLSAQHGQLPPFEQQAAAAEQFLQAHGLLDEPYRIEPLEAERGGVNFVRLLDGLPVINGIGVNRSLIGYNQVIVDPQGQVLQISHSQPGYELQGQFPILSAEQAWERLSAENALKRLRYGVLAPLVEDSYQTWLRELPLDQPLDLYGYPEIMSPASGDPTPLVLFRDYPAGGYTTGMQPGNFLHVWGQLVPADNGRPSLQIEGWDYADLEDTHIEGLLARSGGSQGQVTTDDGASYTLNDLPADLPDGARLQVRGVLVAGVLDWSSIGSGELSMPYGSYLSCGGGGGGGGGGGPLVTNFGEGLFAIPNLSGQPATPEPTIEIPGLPPVGDSLEDVTGIATILIRQSEGASQTQVNLTVDAGVFGEFPAYLRLEGPALDGIEAYHNLPVRIWGQVVSHSDYQAVVQVERYEPAYPGLQVQAWLGTQELVTIEDQPVVLFTAQDGSQFVLKNSIKFGPDSMAGRPGDSVIYEGIAIPGESFGGYPVLRELSGSMAEGISDLSQYQLTQNTPSLFEDIPPQGDQRGQLSGEVTIDQVELAYAAVSTNRCTADDAANPDMAGQLLVQPIWRFTGSFEDGRRIEIQVQALPESYFGQ